VRNSCVGGNGTNIGHRASEFGIPVTVFTWGSKQYLPLLLEDLNHPRKSMRSHIEPTDREIPGAAEMPEAIIFPVRADGGTIDRVIVGTSPLISSEFAHVIDDSWDHIVMNSLGEPNWRESLRDGVDAARDYKRKYTITPGSPTLRAVRKGDDTSALYYGLEYAETLPVTVAELTDLVRGAGQDPSTDIKRLNRYPRPFALAQ